MKYPYSGGIAALFRNSLFLAEEQLKSLSSRVSGSHRFSVLPNFGKGRQTLLPPSSCSWELAIMIIFFLN